MRRRMLPRLAVAGVVLVGASPALADGADEKSVEQAKKVLREARQAYTKAAALTDEMKVTFAMEGMPEQSATAKVRLSKDAAEAKGVAEAIDIHVVDGQLFVEFAGADGVVRTELGDDPLASAKGAMGMAAMYLPPQIALRWADDSQLDSIGEYLTFGMVLTPKITGYQRVEIDGVAMHEIVMTGSNPLPDDSLSTCKVRLDAKTSLLAGLEITGGMEGMDQSISVKASFKPKKVSSLDPPIAFDPGDSVMHESLDALMAAGMGDINPSIEVGTRAPTFELVDQDGKKHSSEVYAGKIMMLDWWGVW